jgi:hypothetical protein
MHAQTLLSALSPKLPTGREIKIPCRCKFFLTDGAIESYPKGTSITSTSPSSVVIKTPHDTFLLKNIAKLELQHLPELPKLAAQS